MAKQIVREYDNSTGSLPTYSNFAVLVPGRIAADKKDAWAAVADENDAYEVTSIADFNANIGRRSGAAINAVAPTLAVLDEDTGATQDFLSVEKVYEYLTSETDNLYLPVAKTQPDDKVGHLEDENYTYSLVSSLADVELTETAEGIMTTDKYCVIKNGNEGVDAQIGDQIGNQVAYELLKLGYTVIYKGFGEESKLQTSYDDLTEADFWMPFRDKSTYQFRYVITGGDYRVETMNRIAELATFDNKVLLERAETILDTNGRGDIIALCDVNEELKVTQAKGTVANIKNIWHAASQIGAGLETGKYFAIFAPRVIYNMSVPDEYQGNTTFPASFHYLACGAYVHSRFAEWYALAGYGRGISTLNVAGTTINFGNIAQNTLSPRTPLPVDGVSINKAVNLIINERGNYYLWGNRTAEPIDEKGLRWSHYLNIRQLCATIKKQVIYAGKMYAFDPNSDVLWVNFKSAVETTLRLMEGDQGINGYKINRVQDNTKGAVKAKIRIVPVEAAEDFDIGLYLEDNITANAIETD